MRDLVYMASRDKVDVDTFYKGIQYALERLGKSKFGFERTTVSNFKNSEKLFNLAVANLNFTTRMPVFELKSNFISIENFKAGNVKVTRPSFFGGAPSYFEALWYPHLYFYRKSNT